MKRSLPTFVAAATVVCLTATNIEPPKNAAEEIVSRMPLDSLPPEVDTEANKSEIKIFYKDMEQFKTRLVQEILDKEDAVCGVPEGDRMHILASPSDTRSKHLQNTFNLAKSAPGFIPQRDYDGTNFLQEIICQSSHESGESKEGTKLAGYYTPRFKFTVLFKKEHDAAGVEAMLHERRHHLQQVEQHKNGYEIYTEGGNAAVQTLNEEADAFTTSLAQLYASNLFDDKTVITDDSELHYLKPFAALYGEKDVKYYVQQNGRFPDLLMRRLFIANIRAISDYGYKEKILNELRNGNPEVTLDDSYVDTVTGHRYFKNTQGILAFEIDQSILNPSRSEDGRSMSFFEFFLVSELNELFSDQSYKDKAEGINVVIDKLFMLINDTGVLNHSFIVQDYFELLKRFETQIDQLPYSAEEISARKIIIQHVRNLIDEHVDDLCHGIAARPIVPGTVIPKCAMGSSVPK